MLNVIVNHRIQHQFVRAKVGKTINDFPDGHFHTFENILHAKLVMIAPFNKLFVFEI